MTTKHIAFNCVHCGNEMTYPDRQPIIDALVAALEALVIEAPKQAVEGSVDSMTFSAAMRQARAALALARKEGGE